MPWIPIENPSKELLDKLWADRVEKSNQTCHDCGVKPGEKHLGGCDVARCLICRGQYLSCGCGDDGYGDVWDGMWPGTRECYEQGLVSMWQGKGRLLEDGYLTFDFNRLALRNKFKL